MINRTIRLIVFLLPLTLSAEIDFNRQVRPILSDHCFQCHGPDAANRKAGLALHERELALAELPDNPGHAAIVPGNVAASELIKRISADDPDDVMPPRKTKRTLTLKQKQILRQWVAEGAAYAQHWAFARLQKPKLPAVKQNDWVRNPIDRFILAHLESQKIKPSPQADTTTLRRRASLALTGLPVSYFKALAQRPIDETISELLQSPHYGERMALDWLDAARYADTDGYQTDGERTMWPWRDWVIKAFNDNMPFDQFTIEQLAGDMLPDATPLQRLASAFNRNHRLNNEGGALPEEFIVEYAIDRVETTAAIWLGLTMGCARCHDHKYDPISQKEFFQFYAYFNSIAEQGKANGKKAPPMLKIGSPISRKDTRELQKKLVVKQKAYEAATKNLSSKTQAWLATEGKRIATSQSMWRQASPLRAVVTRHGDLEVLSDKSYRLPDSKRGSFNYEVIQRLAEGEAVTAVLLEAMPDPKFTAPTRLSRSVNGNVVLSEFTLAVTDTPGVKPTPIQFKRAEAEYSQANYPIAHAIDGNPKTGWATHSRPHPDKPLRALFVLEDPISATTRLDLHFELKHQSTFADHNISRFRIYVSNALIPRLQEGELVDQALIAAIKKPTNNQSRAEKKRIRDAVIAADPELIRMREEITRLETEILDQGMGKPVDVMVMAEKPQPTPAYLLDRGQYDAPDKSEVLSRTVPAAILGDVPPPKDRLELARWIVSEQNPMTARVIVNRIWQHHFGIGLVKTSEDFGFQGELPLHAELLDWLAVTFFESGWNVKSMHRMICDSATWRQSSRHRPELQKADPENRWLAQGPRFRLDGFSIRDQALSVSGLLNPVLGGPPVKPYQPARLWQSVASNAGFRYNPSQGEDLYRRSLYTYWKRAVNPPRQIIFDAAGREACNVRKRITNTPLQALVLMNDETFVEAARALSERMLLEGGATAAKRIQFASHEVLNRPANPKQLNILTANYEFYRKHYSAHPEEAEALLAMGASSRNERLDPVEQAAATATAHLLLNLDETITLE